jgi:flagellar assembly protein FliH
MSDVVKLKIKSSGMSLKITGGSLPEVVEETVSAFNLEKSQEEILQQQLDEAYEKGYSEAQLNSKTEYDAALKEKMAQKTAEFNEILQTIDTQLKEYPEAFEKIVMDVSFLLAEKILKKELEKEGAVFENLKESVSKVMGASDIFVRLNPEDLNRVNKEGGNFLVQDSFSKIKFEGDDRIDRGGCYVETDIGNVDGRISAQLNELKKSLENMLVEQND